MRSKIGNEYISKLHKTIKYILTYDDHKQA